MKNPIFIDRTFLKFILVGLLNTLFGYLIFSFWIFLGLHYYLAIFLTTCIGVLFNFKTIGKLVFYRAENKLFGKFVLVYVIIYIITSSLVKLLLFFGINIYLSGAIAMMIAAACSYLLNKIWVFQMIKDGTN